MRSYHLGFGQGDTSEQSHEVRVQTSLLYFATVQLHLLLLQALYLKRYCFELCATFTNLLSVNKIVELQYNCFTLFKDTFEVAANPS